MAAGGETELNARLLDYINSQKGVNGLKKALLTRPVATRYDLLMSVRGDNAWTGVYRAALRNDVEMVRCMLAEFTPEQAYNVLKLQTGDGNTPLHIAAYCGRVGVVKYLLSCVKQQQRFNLLMMKECRGHTVLYAAFAHNEIDTADLIISTLSFQQQFQLVNIKDKQNKSVADLYPDFIPVELVAKDLAELKSTVDDQAAVIADQKRERARQNEQFVKQKGEMANQKQEAAQLKQEIQKGGEDDHKRVS